MKLNPEKGKKILTDGKSNTTSFVMGYLLRWAKEQLSEHIGWKKISKS
jgi:hypothetical protein